MTKKLPQNFYLRPTLTVAREILGKLLLTKINGKLAGGRIVEVEAYRGDIDKAAHSYNNRSNRTEIMFGPAGYCYVYFIYGMHYCVNIVTEKEDFGAAVLIRAIEPLFGLEIMRKRRGKVRENQLTNGPAKLCQALAIDKKLLGEKVFASQRIWIVEDPSATSFKVSRSKRIGISKSVDLPWRFFVTGNEWVSPNTS